MTGLFINLLTWINKLVGNYGWSIVVFTLLIRLILLPLDIKSKKSMRQITKIQPKLQALQKKYANDKDKLNQKTMELYRKEHVSPTAGCLPMLISLPILWIMFSAMRTLGNEYTIQMILDMKSTGTLPSLQSWLWIKNVFQPDSFAATILPKVGSTLAVIRPSSASAVLTAENITAAVEYLQSSDYSHLAAALAPASAFTNISIPIIFTTIRMTVPNSLANLIQYGNGLFILPLLAGASQFLMTKIMNGKQTEEQKELAQAQQNDQSQTNPMNSPVMKWFFPIFSVWICATSNAAFSIYWMAANVIQIVQQLAVNWYFERQDAKEAATAAQDTDD
ncbi:MAG: YidC/Oxa1 family membrane protein insertase [Clostridia bacterium]|nr:YidC/Oxa1 family membrane protein insertase [Clostridia bacterium]